MKAGSDITLKDKLGRTPLDFAIQNGHNDIAVILRSASAKPTVSSLLYAVKKGNVDLVKSLIADGVDVNARGLMQRIFLWLVQTQEDGF